MTVSIDTLWNYMLDLDILGLVQAVFVGTMGEMAYGITALCILLIIYGRTQSVTYMAIVWVFLGAVLIPMIPMAGWGLGAVILYISLGGLVAFLFLRLSR